MKILVTGGAGYIGSVLVPFLLRKGYDVTVLDNFFYSQTSLLDCCHNKKLSVVRGDVRDSSLMKRLLRDVDIVIPLAALVGAPLCDMMPNEAKAVNYDAVKLLLKLRSKNQPIIFPTTNSGYGIGEKGIECDENTPLRPISLYGKLKVKIEKVLLDSGNVATLRLATVFGISPRMRIDLLVNDFTYRAVFDGFVVLYQADFMRNYIHVRDVARSFLHLIENFDRMKDEPYNVGLSSANLSKRELCEKIKLEVPNFYFVEAEVGEDPDKRDYIVSNAKIEKSGFKAHISVREGIRELIKGYKILDNRHYSNI